jgi:hypothetical protein
VYSPYDYGAHEVCVSELPRGFSSETGQGPWSDEFVGQPWCVCIWAYSNYILDHDDLAINCNAIPSTVLEGEYSLSSFAMCGSMASTEGCGIEDIRRSIESLCKQCDEQAGDMDARKTLKSSCDAIISEAGQINMQRVAFDRAPGLAFVLGGVAVVSIVITTITYALKRSRNSGSDYTVLVEA